MGDAVCVVHVIPSVARSAGGPSEVIRSLLPALRAVGMEARLVTTTKWATPLDRDLLDHDETIVARCMISRWTFAPGVIPALWKEIGRAQVVHVHSIHTFPSTVAMLISRIRRRPVVLEPHGALNGYHLAKSTLAKRLYLKFVDGIGLRSVRSVLCSSSREGREATKVLGLDSICIPLGVDPSLLDIPVDRGGRNVIALFLGRIAKKKRLDILLEAMANPDVQQAGVMLKVAGPIDHDLDFDPKAVVRQQGLDERVEFLGQVDAATRRELLATASFFVLLSDDESFGLSVAEAMAAGLPVICSPNVGLAEDAQARGVETIIPQDSESLALEMTRMANVPNLRSERAIQSRRYALSNLTWSSIAKEMLGVYSGRVPRTPGNAQNAVVK